MPENRKKKQRSAISIATISIQSVGLDEKRKYRHQHNYKANRTKSEDRTNLVAVQYKKTIIAQNELPENTNSTKPAPNIQHNHLPVFDQNTILPHIDLTNRDGYTNERNNATPYGS